MTSIQGDRATVKCARCTTKIVLHDAIRRYVDWDGEWIMVLYSPFMINTDTILCPDCEQSDEYVDSLLDSAPAHDDDSNYVIANHYGG